MVPDFQQYAAPRGAYILKSSAQKKYNLSQTDMDNIDPISVEGRMNGPGCMIKYNLCDVRLLRAKVDDLEQQLSLNAPDGETVPRHGATIVRSKAKKEHNLSDVQMDRIRPCLIKENIYSQPGAPALVDEINSLRTRPAPPEALAAYNAIPEGNPQTNPDYNIFDGMPHDDAAALWVT
ncbi:hypothetical protein K488DRAFT_69703 [Vararia minispora EC-137]|uniref:Uncharacterized protein n=1 Tax=Vararia minispora EC-137 TaxID=1314806 RepID=A0ACB8QP67_9AGAM|nr:hypothetical protein K488DRAFT_69703 [Vararia minispora EC-137]